MIFAGFPSVSGLGMEEGHVATSWLLLKIYSRHLGRNWVAMSIFWVQLCTIMVLGRLGCFRSPESICLCTQNMNEVYTLELSFDHFRGSLHAASKPPEFRNI